MMEIVHVALLLALSVAMHCTCVCVDTVKRVPDSGQEMLLIPEPSVAATSELNVTTGFETPSEGCVVYVYDIGHVVNVGGVRSKTVTVKLHQDETWALLTAVHVTVVTPR